jgi:hypothetical protein
VGLIIRQLARSGKEWERNKLVSFPSILFLGPHFKKEYKKYKKASKGHKKRNIL